MQTPEPRARSRVERTPVGYVIRSASCEMGQGIRRSLRLMGAELLGCEPGQIEIPDPDTDSSPYDTRTTSSRSTHMMGRALEQAVADLRASDGERGIGEVVNEGGLDPDTRPGRRLLALAPGRGRRARDRRRGDRARSPSSTCTRRSTRAAWSTARAPSCRTRAR